MDTLIGAIMWVVIIAVVVSWVSNRRPGSGDRRTSRPRSPAPPPPSPEDVERDRRADGAFVDGLIIGAHYYGDHDDRDGDGEWLEDGDDTWGDDDPGGTIDDGDDL